MITRLDPPYGKICHPTNEITKCCEYLAQFIRKPEHSFADTITTFDAVYVQWQQLLRPVQKTELADLSITILRQITPFLVSDKTSKRYIAWQEQQHQYQRRITKELILDVVQGFEAQLDLQLTEKKRLPQHLGFSQTDPITVDTHAAGIQARSSSSYLTDRSPSNHQKHKSSERRSSQDRNDRGQCLDRSKHQDTRDKPPLIF